MLLERGSAGWKGREAGRRGNPAVGIHPIGAGTTAHITAVWPSHIHSGWPTPSVPPNLTNPITPLTFWSRSHTDTNHRDRRQRTCTTGATQCRTHTALNSWADVQPFNNIQLWTRQWPEATYQHTALDCSTVHVIARHHLYSTSIKWGGDRYCTTCVIGNLGLISVAAIEERLLFSTFRRTGEALTPPPGHGISGQIALRTPIGTGQNWSTHTNNSRLALTFLRLKRHHGRIQAAPKTQQHLPSGVAATVTRK